MDLKARFFSQFIKQFDNDVFPLRPMGNLGIYRLYRKSVNITCITVLGEIEIDKIDYWQLITTLW